MNAFFLAVLSEAGPARQALTHNGLASHAQEWSREWQRAQARAWLHATPEPGFSAGRPGGADGGALEGVRGSAGKPRCCAAENHPAARVVHSPSTYVRTGAAPDASFASPTQRVSVLSRDFPLPVESPQPDIAGGWKLATRQAPVQRETVHRAPSDAHVSQSERDTLRLHIECAGDGLHVWIGADGDAAAVSARAAAILAELRRSGHVPSVSLASVVCNGRTLYTSGTRAPSFLENPP